MNSRPKTVLFVTTFQLHPVAGGGAARVLAMVDHFRANGLRVEVVTLRHQSGAYPFLEKRFDRLWTYAPKSRSAQQGLKTRLEAAPWGRRLLESAGPPWRALKQAGRKIKGRFLPVGYDPDSAISRNRKPGLEVYAGKVLREVKPVAVIAECVWTARSLDQAPPNALKILNTHDIQHLRFPTAKEAGFEVDRLACTREEEVLELNRADLLLAIQEKEAGILRDMCPDRRVIVVEHAHTTVSKVSEPEDPLAVLFVGNYYEPNLIGLKNFLSSAWPRVLEKFPEAKFLVCGKVCQGIEQPPPGVELLGLVPSLEEYYQRAAIVVNPVPFGTGLKIKTVEALAQAKCLVSTECGVFGLPAPSSDNPYCRVASIAEMGDTIAGLLANPEDRRTHEAAALRFAGTRFGADATYGELTEMISRIPTY